MKGVRRRLEWLDATDHQTRELGKAIMLAPTLTICECLLRGETVPIAKLDPTWVRKLGRP